MKSGVHMIFDAKLDAGFTQKARIVADGLKQNAPISITYSSVVSHDSVRIMITLAALNGLDIQTADAKNAYLNTNPKECVYFHAGTEFGKNEGKLFIVVRVINRWWCYNY